MLDTTASLHRILDRKKERKVKSNANSTLTISTDIKGNVHKEFVPAGQTVKSAKTSSRTLAAIPTGSFIATTHRLTLPYSPGNSAPKYDCRPPLTIRASHGSLLLFSLSAIEDTAILTQLRCSRQNRKRC
jgi:hypothetical protein